MQVAFFENMWKKPLAFCVKHDTIVVMDEFLYIKMNFNEIIRDGGKNDEDEKVNGSVTDGSVRMFYGGMRRQREIRELG